MDSKTFFEKVVKMRELQKQYSRTRSSETLRQSKRLEKEIDDEIERVQQIIHKQNNPTLW